MGAIGMSRRKWVLFSIGLVGVLVVAGKLAVARNEDDTPPAGVEQLLARGKIAAVLDPQFVPAGESKISDDAWGLGVVIEGQAKAYSLNLLNRHEVVNDQSGDTAYAAVW